MKRNYFLGAAAAFGLFALASCSNEDDPISPNQPGVEEEAAQEIILQVANTGDGLTTKAGRPLFSSEAKQSIDKVKVYIVASDGSSIAAEKEFTNWSTDAVSQIYSNDGHGRQATWKLSGDQRLTPGETYMVYAVGYISQGSLYNNAIAAYEGLSTSFKKFISNVTVTEDELGEEIFAGTIASLKVDPEGNFDLTTDPEANVLTLHRQVSGTMGYFTSIPTLPTGQYVEWDEDGSKYLIQGTGATGSDEYSPAVDNLSLRLVASNISSSIILDNFNSEFTEENDDNSNAWFVVNGVQANGNIDGLTTGNFSGVNEDGEGYVLYTINLKDWFPNGDANNDGLLDEADVELDENNWNTPASVKGASFKPGSVFAGKFLIPFVKVANQKTLQLQLVKDGSTVLRTWNINLPQDDRQIYPSEGHAEVWNGYEDGSAFADNSIGETQDSYSLVRNHLYTIGAKTTDDYNPGTDEPEDLSKGQNLILKVNDNWEMIHKMEIE